MSDLSAKNYRCSNCGAPLMMERVRDGHLKCLFCGTSHHVSSKKADEERKVQADRRLGGIIAPFLAAALVGSLGLLALRDFWWSVYDGHPAAFIGVLFVILGLMSFRVPAALGLMVLGVAGVLKPFVRPIPVSWGDGFYSATSETAFYYLVPGAIGVALALAFLASLKLKELRPALSAMRPRVSVVLVTLAGAAASHLVIGETQADLAKQYRVPVQRLLEVAHLACDVDPILKADQVPLDPLPTYNPEQTSNSFFVSCDELKKLGGFGADSIYLDELRPFAQAHAGRKSDLHRGAEEYHRAEYRRLDTMRYLVAYKGDKQNMSLSLLDIPTGAALVKLPAVGGLPLQSREDIFEALASSTGGSFPERKYPKASSMSSASNTALPLTQPPSEALSAEFEFHSAVPSGIGALWIYGFVTNTSRVAISKAEVIVVFKDADGKELTTGHGYSANEILVGERAPIGIVISEPPKYESLAFETHASALFGIEISTGLTITEHSSRKDQYGSYTISGKVKNQGDAPAKFASVVVLMFDDDDKLIGLPNGYAKAETLAPGAEARFLITGRPYGKPLARIEVEVHGRVGTP